MNIGPVIELILSNGSKWIGKHFIQWLRLAVSDGPDWSQKPINLMFSRFESLPYYQLSWLYFSCVWSSRLLLIAKDITILQNFPCYRGSLRKPLKFHKGTSHGIKGTLVWLVQTGHCEQFRKEEKLMTDEGFRCSYALLSARDRILSGLSVPPATSSSHTAYTLQLTIH